MLVSFKEKGDNIITNSKVAQPSYHCFNKASKPKLVNIHRTMKLLLSAQEGFKFSFPKLRNFQIVHGSQWSKGEKSTSLYSLVTYLEK